MIASYRMCLLAWCMQSQFFNSLRRTLCIMQIVALLFYLCNKNKIGSGVPRSYELLTYGPTAIGLFFVYFGKYLFCCIIYNNWQITTQINIMSPYPVHYHSLIMRYAYKPNNYFRETVHLDRYSNFIVLLLNFS